MVVIKLREAIAEHATRTGNHLTYADLAELTGLARATLESIGSRGGYNPTLTTIERICRALDCDIGHLLMLDPPSDQEEAGGHQD